MDASFTKGAVMIALQQFRAAGRTFEPGDHFPWQRLAISERLVRQMSEQHIVGVLSQETYELAIGRREDGLTVPGSFTLDGLEHYGIEVKKAKKARAQKPVEPAASADYDEVIDYRGYRVGKRKQGVVTGFDVLSDAGERLNAGARLRGVKQLDAFIDTLPKRDSASEAGEGGGDAAPAAGLDDAAYGDGA